MTYFELFWDPSWPPHPRPLAPLGGEGPGVRGPGIRHNNSEYQY